MSNNITDRLKYKESVVKFSKKYGTARAAYKFGECKRTIYRWRSRYDGTLEELGLEYKVIKPHTPKQNGRVERSHRKDQERFYYKRVFYSLKDLRNQGKEWRKEYNNFPMRPLEWLSPRKFIEKYKSQEESLFAI